MPDMQQQVDALREAFSADTRKPFVLKPSFPYGSPGAPLNRTPPRGIINRPPGSQSSMDSHQFDAQSVHQQPQVSYTSHPISPPISTGGVDTKSDSPAVQSLVMMATGQQQRTPQQQAMNTGMSMGTEGTTWNPSRIFE